MAPLFNTIQMPSNPFQIPLRLGDVNWPASVERAELIQTARIWTRDADFEPFFVDADVDTGIRILLEPYKESRFNPPTLFPIPDRWSVRSALPLACLLEPQKRVRKGR